MSKLTDVLYLLYSYQQDDIDKLAKRLTERRRAAWINELSSLASTHGCARLAGTPKGADARELARMSQVDAESIANTYNRELRARIERIAKANPRANRNVYYRQLDQWARRRDAHKALQIGLNTDSTARQFAFTRFYQMNTNLAQRFAAAGAPPTCKICIRIFAAGVVDFAYTQRNPLSAHINCPHYYKPVAPTKAQCDVMWLG